MTTTPRDPHADNDLIAELTEEVTPSQSGGGGGILAREIGGREEEQVALGGDPVHASIHKGDKPNGGDAPNLPNRDAGPAMGSTSDHRQGRKD